MSYDREINFALSLAEEAGNIMLEYFNTAELGTILKADNTPVTIADTTINNLVIERVKNSYPDYGVIGEESSYDDKNEKVWVVDPVDGTVPFSAGIPLSTFSLALVESGETKVAVVYDPFMSRLYSAVVGGGTHLNGQKIEIDLDKDITGGVCFLGSGRPQAAGNILRDTDSLKTMDIYSFAYSGVAISDNRFVAAVMEYGSPWDAAAVSLIVEEAGGVASDLNGQKRQYNKWGDGIVLASPKLHAKLIEYMKNENTRD